MHWTPQGLEQLQAMIPKLKFYECLEDIKKAIEAVLITDPRSIFIRSNSAAILNSDQCRKTFGEDIYGFCIDIMNILCKFGIDEVTVVGIEDWSGKVPKRGKPKDSPKEECDKGKLFFEVHNSMARESPGSNATTQRAIMIVQQFLNKDTTIELLDVGCGPGMQTIELARHFPTANISALDTHQPFLKEVTRRAKSVSEDTHKRIQVVQGSMLELNNIFTTAGGQHKMFDIIWSEGALS